jgi:hypothetical protein
MERRRTRGVGLIAEAVTRQKLGPGRFDRDGWRDAREGFHAHTVEV